MAQERIDLTEDGLRKQISKYAEEYLYPTSDVDMGDVENILHCINSIGLIAELKRCYEEIDNLVKEKNRLIDIAERGGAWDGGIDISDINEDYGACNLCGSIRSGCCEDASE